MVWHTHRLAWIALPWFVLWMMTVNEVWENWYSTVSSWLYHVNLIIIWFAIFLSNLPDFDQNSWNTPADVVANFWKQWFIEQSLRILLKKLSWWEHRWFTHSLVFIVIVWLLISPLLLFWFWLYDIIFLLLALSSHALIDMFNNSWSRLLWPLNLKLNFLNIVPNLLTLKTNKKNQVRSKWWDIPVWFKILWIIILSIISVFVYIKMQTIDLNIFLKVIVFIPIFYVYLKLLFVKTWSEDEVYLWQYPLTFLIFVLIILNLWWVYVSFQNATTWLAHHPIFLVFLVLFLAFKWIEILSKDFKRFFDTKQLWWALTAIIILWTLFKFPIILDEIKKLTSNDLKTNISISETYKSSIEKLKNEISFLINKNPIKIDEEWQKIRWVFSWIEDFKNNYIKKKREEYINKHKMNQ